MDENLGDQIKAIVTKLARQALGKKDGWHRVNFHLSFNAKVVQGGIHLADFATKTRLTKSDKVDPVAVAPAQKFRLARRRKRPHFFNEARMRQLSPRKVKS